MGQATGAGRAKNCVLLLLGVAVVGGLGYFVVWLVRLAVTSGVGAAIVAASMTALASVLSVTLAKRWELRKEIQQEHREQKLPLYGDFMAFWFSQLGRKKPTASPAAGNEVEEFARQFHQKLILWGADPVVREYSQFLRRVRSPGATATSDKAPEIEVLFGFERVLLAMRADIGHPNKDLKQGDLLRLFVTDVEKYLGS